ncbi:hypothetical protein TYRP_012049 [Tyrophagus putrescentiae]|nr:hypothetical protein TYRP_012049 [Tyrophagus putrescentiae]
MLTPAEQKTDLICRLIATCVGLINGVGCVTFLIYTRNIFSKNDLNSDELATQAYIFGISSVTLLGQVIGFTGIILKNIILCKIQAYMTYVLIILTILRGYAYPILWAFFLWFLLSNIVNTMYYMHLEEMKQKRDETEPPYLPTKCATSRY